MKLIILAAGEGTRLRPHTLDRPKCMVKFDGKPIIDHILSTAKTLKLNKVVIVCGYKEPVLKEHLKNEKVIFLTNERFNSTNMLASLFCAESEMNDDIIISYADIVYKKEILEALIKNEKEMSVVVDKSWHDLWAMRMEDPLADAETLKLNDKGTIAELGKKPKSTDDIQGQYMGLIKIRKEALPKIISFYHSLDKNKIYDGKSFDNMFMTSFIQLIIDHLIPVHPVFINGGWIEIDSVQDLEIYTRNQVKI